jgi:hypothetical protein
VISDIVLVPLCYQPYWRALSVPTVLAGAFLIGQTVDPIHLKARKSASATPVAVQVLVEPAASLFASALREKERGKSVVLPGLGAGLAGNFYGGPQAWDLLRRVEKSLLVVSNLVRFL